MYNLWQKNASEPTGWLKVNIPNVNDYRELVKQGWSTYNPGVVRQEVRKAQTTKNVIADNTIEDLKEELKGTKKTYYDTKNILPGALDPFKNIDMNNVVKIVFIAVVGKMILNKIF